jgi:hypothetical protein
MMTQQAMDIPIKTRRTNCTTASADVINSTIPGDSIASGVWDTAARYMGMDMGVVMDSPGIRLRHPRVGTREVGKCRGTACLRTATFLP